MPAAERYYGGERYSTTELSELKLKIQKLAHIINPISFLSERVVVLLQLGD